MVHAIRHILKNRLFHLTLLTAIFPAFILLATLYAPTVEHGIFAVSFGLAVPCILLIIRDNQGMDKATQLAVCCLLTTCLVLSAASLVDIADISLLKDDSEGLLATQTKAIFFKLLYAVVSLLIFADYSPKVNSIDSLTVALAGVVFVLLILTIAAAWLNRHFLVRYAGLLLVAVGFWFMQSDTVNRILVELPEIRPLALPFTCLIGFCFLTSYRQRLSDNRYWNGECLGRLKAYTGR